MLMRLHEMRRHEEGQALVLAAVCMLVLALCVLATVNLSYMASEKVKLQNAADAAAYTTAAYEARALNFFAYSNRAMVVQYTGQMNMLAVVSYMMFNIMVMRSLSYLPYVGWIFGVLTNIMKTVTTIIDAIVAIAVPVIDVMNFGLSVVQRAVATSLMSRVKTGVAAEMRRYNPNYLFEQLTESLLGQDLQQLFEKTVTTSATPRYFPPTDAEDKFNRVVMTEIANSARHPWTAYGGPRGSSFPLIPRYARVGLPLNITLTKRGRAEWGAFQPKLTSTKIWDKFLEPMKKPSEQLYSRDELELKINFFVFRLSFNIGSWIRADRAVMDKTWHNNETSLSICWGLNWFTRRVCRAVMRPIGDLLAKGAQYAMRDAKIPDGFPHVHFGQAPYARFRPGRRTWSSPSGAELFQQPAHLVMVTLPTADLVARGQPFMSSFGAKLGSLSSAQSPLAAEAGGQHKAPKRGWQDAVDFRPLDERLASLPPGFHAMSAALTYYHRPGDWQEPPNLFNPFWGAKLMPVGDCPDLARSPLLAGFVRDQVMVH
ncbi:MAG: hypothetical protein RL199_467 [Pseudomonadota bacterium]|jgi:Flp pilus assembly protein TadG